MRGLVTLALLIALTVIVAGCLGTLPYGEMGEPRVKTLVATGYCECSDCCGWERNWYGRPVFSSGPKRGRAKIVGQTSSGVMARRGTIAADTTRYPYGTIMYIEGYGYGRVEDTGGAVKGDHIDLYFYSHHQAKQWGRKTVSVKIWPARDIARATR